MGTDSMEEFYNYTS